MKIKGYSSIFHHLSKALFKGHNYSLHSIPFICIQKNFTSWHIVGAVCLERKPVITQPLHPIEQKYYQYLLKLEVEKSYLSDHEKRHLDDIKSAEKLKKGELEDMDMIAKQTAQDFEDACLEKFNKYHPNSRITEADKSNDQQSLQRKLDSSLVLVIKQKLGNDFRWILPQAVHQDGETLRQTAERSLRDLYPKQLKVQFMGNAPVGYYKYKYPKLARVDGICGAKVFFFKAQLLPKQKVSLDIQKSDSVSDALWLTHSELNEYVQNDYGKAVQSFLFPDSLDIDCSDISQSPSSVVDEPVKSSALN